MRAILCAAAICLGAGSANAATWNFSYDSETGGSLAGRFIGDLQDDGDTIVVSAVSDVSFAGSAGPALPSVMSYLSFSLGSDRSPTATLSGDVMDILACNSPACSEGFLFTFAGIIGGGGAGVASSPAFGSLVENFDPARYTATAIPLPASAALLAGGLALLGLVARGSARRRNPPLG
jgi:hypothetical protein